MKHFHWFALVLLLMIIGSLFLPYETHDIRDGWFKNPGIITKRDVHQAGLSIWGAYLPIVLFLLLSFFIVQWKNLAVAIIGLVGSIGILLYDGVMAIVLTFNLNFGGGPVNKHVNSGFYLLVLATIGFIVLMIVNLIIVAKQRKQLKTAKNSATDLLDDVLD